MAWIQIHGIQIRYDSFHWKCSIPTIHQIEKLRFCGTLRYIYKFRIWWRIWCNLNLYQGIRVCRFGGFRGWSIIRGICLQQHIQTRYLWAWTWINKKSHTHTHLHLLMGRRLMTLRANWMTPHIHRVSISVCVERKSARNGVREMYVCRDMYVYRWECVQVER